MINFAIIGFGSRGQMFAKIMGDDDTARLVAVAETNPDSLAVASSEFGVPASSCYSSADEFFKQGKICDAVFICTQDAQHYDMTIKALNLGYDICLEKPAATSVKDCVSIRDIANKLGRKIMLTHVMRYAPFYAYIKKLVMDGALGDVATINQTENIAYWHFALSYVRGPWRNMEQSSPTIIAKCCHDLDILLWLMNKKCTAVSSFGSLFHFRDKNAPEGSAEYCADCSPEVREKCLYNAYKVYPERMKHGVVGGTARFKNRDIIEVIDNKEDVICKCVYHAGNDAIDNQVVNLQFEDGSTAHLTMTAFSDDCHRTVKIHGTKGEVFGDMDQGILYYTPFGKETVKIDVNKEFNPLGINTGGGHGGGDTYLYYDFKNYITENKPSITRTTIDQSIDSHVVGFSAEQSRKDGGKVIKL